MNDYINILKNNVFTNEHKFPKTATRDSTGYDLLAVSDPIIVGSGISDGTTGLYYSIDYIQYHTGLHLEFPTRSFTQQLSANSQPAPFYDALIFPRSSIRKYNLTLANGVGLCDSDYRGEYIVCFKYIVQPEDLRGYDGGFIVKPNLNKIYKNGDKIAQLKFTKVEPAHFRLVDSFTPTERNAGGFGSTDNKKI
jgi:dUTPase